MKRGLAENMDINFRYLQLADEIESKIIGGVYKAGEKLPSIRKLHNETGFSITTVYQAYIELENRGAVEPKNKSGFYAKPPLATLLPSPTLKKHKPKPKKVSINALAASIVDAMRDPSFVQLGGTAPAPELLPYKQLFRAIRSATDPELREILTAYEDTAGALELRRLIAQRTLAVSETVKEADIIITNGCLEAVSLCLRAVARPGDTVIVESPTFHCFLQLIEDLNMFALELPTDPQTGIDLPSLARALDHNDVKACILIPNFHNPLGFSMPMDKKKELVALLNHRQVPVIEDNIYGDLYFGPTRPVPLKAFDRKGLVLHCGSFSKTLAPGLRVGWTLAGRFTDTVKRLKLNTSITSPALNQFIIARFLKNGGYDRHLRRLRNALKNNVSNTALAIARHFPAGTRITAPQGGLILWVELNHDIDGLAVYEEARKERIAIIPGILCSNSKKYRNFIRISCGQPWDEKLEAAIAKLGEIVSTLI